MSHAQASTKFAANAPPSRPNQSTLCVDISLQAPVSEHRTGRSEFLSCSNVVAKKHFPHRQSKETKLAPPRGLDSGIRLLAQKVFYVLNSVQA